MGDVTAGPGPSSDHHEEGDAVALSKQTYDNGVTIGLALDGKVQELAEKMDKRHGGHHDAVLVYVPKGMAQDARDRIWTALDSAPTQSPGEFERDQALAYEGNIGRMFGSL